MSVLYSKARIEFS